MPSSEPWSTSSRAAVLSPTPGMPGMLSVVSPLSALKSIIWPGVEAVSLVDPLRVVDDGRLDAQARRHELRALGDELEHVEVARDDDRLDVLAHLRLAGQRADEVVGLEALHLVRSGMPKAASVSRTIGNWSRRSSGVGRRVAL